MIVVPSVKNLLTEHILALMDMLVVSSEDSRWRFAFMSFALADRQNGQRSTQCVDSLYGYASLFISNFLIF
ncbi:hypothetical protein GCM10017706_28430 [Lactococcus lactis subsp. hordniae]